MMIFGVIVIGLGMSFLSFLAVRNFTVSTIKEIGISPSHPKRYIAPKKWMKKLFGFNRNLIAKYLYFEHYVAIIFAIIGPLNILFYVIFKFNTTLFGIITMIHSALIVLNTIYFAILYVVHKRF